MNMKLTLAVALECFPTDCRVQLVEGGSIITAAYSAPVQAHIKVRPGQLVALDTNPATPEIVYRWHYNQVEELKGDKVIIKDHQGQLVELVRAEGLEAAPQVGDWVFVTLGGNFAPSEVFDVAIDGRPAHPAYFSEYAFPKVEQFYRRITGNS